VFVAFFYRPFLNLLNWGTFESRAGGAFFEDVGLRQYREQLTSDDFREGLWHSIQFVIYTVPAGLVLGILLAVAAHRRLAGIKVFQTIFTSTLASSVAVTSVIFLYLLNPVVGIFQVGWLNDPDMAMFAVALSAIWQNMGLSFVIVLAGLQAVPDEVMEAATLDGYGSVKRLLRITLPLISPVLLFLLVVLVIFGLQAFAQIDIITKGAPAGATETLVFKINRLVRPDNIGIGAVYSVGLFVVTVVVTAVQFVILDRRVHYAR
jgi:sn-glycerol 3-phosphate transport system permease protein